MNIYKKSYYITTLTILICFMFTICTFAADKDLTGNVSSVDKIMQYKSRKEVGVTGNPRGRWISSVELTLTDKGSGTIGIYSEILCHEPMKNLRMWLYLEKWVDEYQDWDTVQYEHFEWAAEDFPNEDLTVAIAAYDVSKLERGCDYRVRGLYGADSFQAGLSENWSVNTPDFFLE